MLHGKNEVSIQSSLGNTHCSHSTPSPQKGEQVAETERKIWLMTKLVLTISPDSAKEPCYPGDSIAFHLSAAGRIREFCKVESSLTGYCILTTKGKDDVMKQVQSPLGSRILDESH